MLQLNANEILWANLANKLLANINHQTRRNSAILPRAPRAAKNRAARFVQELLQRGEWVRGTLLDLQQQSDHEPFDPMRKNPVSQLWWNMFYGIEAAVRDQVRRADRDKADQYNNEQNVMREQEGLVRRSDSLRHEIRTMDRVFLEETASPGQGKREYFEEFLESVRRYRQSNEEQVEH